MTHLSAQLRQLLPTANVGHMSSGGFRSDSLSTEAETIIEVQPLTFHKTRHYIYAVLAAGNFYFQYFFFRFI